MRANLPSAAYWGDDQRFRPKGHLTDCFTNNAIAAIEANKHRPFFMYLAYNAPHTPLQATKPDCDALQKLKGVGLDQNTLVIFTSDNGGA